MTVHEWGTAPEFVGPRHELRERLLVDLLLSGRPGRSILNAGAGQGSLSVRLEALGYEVTSVDASPAAVAVLRDHVGGEAIYADVNALPFREAQFDAAVLGEVLEHVANDAAALREIARVVRPGGAVAISVPANPKLYGRSDRWAGHLRRYTRGDLLRACDSAGLRVERCLAWGFPVSRLYHRHVYERYLDRRGPAPPGRLSPLVGAFGLLFQVDRLFVGVERGALGYLALAARP